MSYPEHHYDSWLANEPHQSCHTQNATYALPIPCKCTKKIPDVKSLSH
jgi:hypothetical protein